MPISINGSGTITGVSVGGLPDGIVDTDMIANSNVTAGKLASGAGGKILQIQSLTTESKTDTTSESFVDVNGFSLAITPSAATSKVLIIASSTLEQDGSGNFSYATILRGSTNLGHSTGGLTLSHEYYYPGQQDQEQPCTMVFLDSPNTTSATTYKVQIRKAGGNRVGWNGSQSTIKGSFMLIEVGA